MMLVGSDDGMLDFINIHSFVQSNGSVHNFSSDSIGMQIGEDPAASRI